MDGVSFWEGNLDNRATRFGTSTLLRSLHCAHHQHLSHLQHQTPSPGDSTSHNGTRTRGTRCMTAHTPGPIGSAQRRNAAMAVASVRPPVMLLSSSPLTIAYLPDTLQVFGVHIE
eukprot:4252340-Amphidinium_carterae.2